MAPQRMVGLGSRFPLFRKKACVSTEKGKEFTELTSDELTNTPGRWTVMFWWPKDFTFVCPTEIAAFNKAVGEFKDRNTQLIGASTDSEFVHVAWRRDHADLKDLKFPMLADTSKSLSEELGILTADEKVAYRVTYIIDPDGITRWVHGWKRNGWVTASKKPVQNAELWHDLIEVAGKHQIEWIWVKGHDGHPENERVDRLASDAALAVGKSED